MLKANITFLPRALGVAVDRAHHGAAPDPSNGQAGPIGLELVVLDEVDAGLAEARRPARPSPWRRARRLA